MALSNKPTPKFETEDDTLETTNETTKETTMTESTNVPAVQSANALTPAAVTKGGVLSALKDVFRVDYDSLPSLQVAQGSFAFKDDVKSDLGDSVQMQLSSYQEQWVVGPNDKKAEMELVKYSDDGITSTDGTDMKQHLADLIDQGFKGAKMAHRVILVGELLSVSKGSSDRVGELVQLNLPDSGRRAFNSYAIQAAYAVSKGRKSAEEVAKLVLTAVKETSRSGDIYTKVVVTSK